MLVSTGAAMTVTRYKRQPTVDRLREAVLGVMRHAPGERKSGGASRRKRDAAEEAPAADETKSVKPARQAPLKISPAVKARAQRLRANRLEQIAQLQFRAYEPAPGVLPKDTKPEMAMDTGLAQWSQNTFTNAWNAANPMGDSFAEGIGFLGYAYLSQL